jgi:hypothetical protein
VDRLGPIFFKFNEVLLLLLLVVVVVALDVLAEGQSNCGDDRVELDDEKHLVLL